MNYLDLAVLALILAIGFLSWRHEDKAVALPFAGILVAHTFAFWNAEGLAYYGSAALADLLFLVVTVSHPSTKLLESLLNISLVSILLNFVGWFIWHNYLPVTPYKVAFALLYTYTAWVLWQGNRKYVGHNGSASGFIDFRVDNRAGLSHKTKAEG